MKGYTAIPTKVVLNKGKKVRNNNTIIIIIIIIIIITITIIIIIYNGNRTEWSPHSVRNHTSDKQNRTTVKRESDLLITSMISD